MRELFQLWNVENLTLSNEIPLLGLHIIWIINFRFVLKKQSIFGARFFFHTKI